MKTTKKAVRKAAEARKKEAVKKAESAKSKKGGKNEIDSKPAFRFFILGAGFSRPAGLPLANGLWAEVYRRQRDNISGDLERYVRFKEKCDGVVINPDCPNFDFEAFMGFLDIEHWLRLRGGDTTSDEGNWGQLVIRQEIGRVLTERTPAIANIPAVYLKFARELKPQDMVLTFNYDTLLERALDKVGKKYRLFPERYSKIYDDDGYGITTDDDDVVDEVIVFKMHGSVDWFSKEVHDKALRSCRGIRPRAHPMFGKDNKGTDAKFRGAVPLLEGKQCESDPLRHIWRLPEVAKVVSFYESDCSPEMCAPWLLPPSTDKVVYLPKLLSFWKGMGKAGGYNLGLVVIGYSLPSHDNYVRQLLFYLAGNYQGFYWKENFIVGYKSPIVLIDAHPDKVSQEKYCCRYGFVDPKKARFHFSGFNDEAVELIREARHMALGRVD